MDEEAQLRINLEHKIMELESYRSRINLTNKQMEYKNKLTHEVYELAFQWYDLTGKKYTNKHG